VVELNGMRALITKLCDFFNEQHLYFAGVVISHLERIKNCVVEIVILNSTFIQDIQ